MRTQHSGRYGPWFRWVMVLTLVSSLVACAATPSSVPAPPPTATLPMPITRDTAEQLIAAIPNATAVSIYTEQSVIGSYYFFYDLQRNTSQFAGYVTNSTAQTATVAVPLTVMQPFLAALAQTTVTDVPYHQPFTLHGVPIRTLIRCATPAGVVGLIYEVDRALQGTEWEDGVWRVVLGFSPSECIDFNYFIGIDGKFFTIDGRTATPTVQTLLS